MAPFGLARSASSDGHGDFSVMTKLLGLGAVIDAVLATRKLSREMEGFSVRVSEYRTSAEVSCFPLENLTPWRMWNV